MTGHMWILGVRPGYEAEYRRRHDDIWPEMLTALSDAGIRNYSIFRHGLDLFGYFETDDLKASVAKLAGSDANRRWGEWMAPIMRIEVDPATGFPYLLPREWHMS